MPNFNPIDPGLEEAYQASKNMLVGNNLETVLGLATKLPLALANAAAEKKKKADLLRLLQTKGQEFATPGSAEEALQQAQAAAQLQKPITAEDLRKMKEEFDRQARMAKEEHDRQMEEQKQVNRIALEGEKQKMARNKYITAEEANSLLGDQIFPPGTMVSPGERILAAQKVNREKPSIQARQQLVAIKDSEKFLDQMQGKFNELSLKGKTGPIAGRIASTKAYLTSGVADPDVAAYKRLKQGLVGRLKSVAGEVGRITDEDVKRMGALIAEVESGTVAANDAFGQIKEVLNNGRGNIRDVFPSIDKYSNLGNGHAIERPKTQMKIGPPSGYIETRSKKTGKTVYYNPQNGDRIEAQ